MGSGGNNLSRMNYKDCVEAMSHARDKSAGKPLPGGIRIFDRGTHLAVQQYRTDIVRYYADGSIEICTGWASQTTLNAIGNLTGKQLWRENLPLYNGRKPYPEKAYMVDGVVFNGVNGYLRFDPAGKVDKASVKAIALETITDIPAVRRAQKKAKALCDQLLLRFKIGVKSGRYGLTFAWVEHNLDVPLDEVDYSPYPTKDPHKIYVGAGHWFAKKIGATATVQFKEFA